MPKRFAVGADEIKPLAIGRGSCIVSNRIAVDHQPIGVMYRDTKANEGDSGWFFMAGDEPKKYLADPDSYARFDINLVANYDPAVIPHLDDPIGACFSRRQSTGVLEPYRP